MKSSILFAMAFFSLLITLPTSSPSAASLEDYIANYNPGQAHAIATAIEDAGATFHIDPRFLAAVYKIESGFHNEAVSSAGARGIAQLMPDTASGLGVNPYDYRDNIFGGAKYLREMLDIHANKGVYQYNYALASYNAGPGNVENTIPSYTYDYISMVQGAYKELLRYTPSSNTLRISPPTSPNPAEQLLMLYKLKEIKLLSHHKKRRS